MKTIRITSDFSGYPDGVNERVFTTGQEPDDLDDAYADLLLAKGLAEETGPAKPQRPAPAAPAAPTPTTETASTVTGQTKETDA